MRLIKDTNNPNNSPEALTEVYYMISALAANSSTTVVAYNIREQKRRHIKGLCSLLNIRLMVHPSPAGSELPPYLLRALVRLHAVWDINNPDNSPEQFTETYYRNFGLGGETPNLLCASGLAIGPGCIFGVLTSPNPQPQQNFPNFSISGIPNLASREMCTSRAQTLQAHRFERWPILLVLHKGIWKRGSPAPTRPEPQTALVTALPLLKDEVVVTHGGALPEVTEAEMRDVKRWMERDTAFQDVYARVRDKRSEEETALRSIRSARWEVDGMGGISGGKFHVMWPIDQRKMKIMGRKDLDVYNYGELYVLRARPADLFVSKSDDQLRIELVLLTCRPRTQRLRSVTFVGVNRSTLSMDAELLELVLLCDDFQIPSATVVQAVSKSIAEQLAEHRAHIVDCWRRWRRKLADGTVATRDEADDTLVDEEDKTMFEELRVLVKLDVIVGTMNLTDQFKWDINNSDNSPQELAEVYCCDLSLGGEFKCHTRASIDIPKSLFLVGHPPGGTPVADDELRAAMLPSIEHSFRFDRTLLEQFTPQLNMLQEGGIARNERECEKELKRKRRQTCGRRGVALPDRELQKTHRTSIRFAEVEVSSAQQAAQQQLTVSPHRAAAAVTSLTIANLVANENGMPMPTSMNTIEWERSTPIIPAAASTRTHGRARSGAR
ncbi:SWI/SNF chromatin-remodeling complex subunit [Ceratobasidium sp. 392]|nr:SWI/SNF chromatin-remodeling complex subunit [Ceratobasidium sp. 392]